jgi:hypothetical protein
MFGGICSEALDLLQINCHVLSGNNHNPMMVEIINQYLTKGLKIMTNERNSVWIALLANILLLYAWNSCPILEWTYPEASLQLAVNLLFESITQQITLGTNLLPFQHGIILKRSCRLPLSTL